MIRFVESLRKVLVREVKEDATALADPEHILALDEMRSGAIR